MKTISVVGLPSNNIRMFILELAWVMSRNKKVYCHIGNQDFYDCFSEASMKLTDIGNVTLLHQIEDLQSPEQDAYLLSDELMSNADTVIFAVEQNMFSIRYINRYAFMEEPPQTIFAFLDFIPSNFDDHYLKHYYFDKRLTVCNSVDFYFEFDEKTRLMQIENQFNRIIDMKKYPKSRKIELLNLSDSIIADSDGCSYKEYFKSLDERLSTC